ncbi:hypothetical protein NA56DRAFT_750656 [Hyaloscypha hepaticicola]|uniref:Uncharacterized protein n=1 Tax=Hyaloscypha hepaticicola TaxID=2082293 RepID=A0A2J6PYR0_9HELO|nr:hypothetical protein NA56DRAFT_750656 [Hyaloscypha hepaticicola]
MCELEYVVKFNGIGDLNWSEVELRRHIFSAPESWEGRGTEADAVYDLESPPSVIFDGHQTANIHPASRLAGIHGASRQNWIGTISAEQVTSSTEFIPVNRPQSLGQGKIQPPGTRTNLPYYTSRISTSSIVERRRVQVHGQVFLNSTGEAKSSRLLPGPICWRKYGNAFKFFQQSSLPIVKWLRGSSSPRCSSTLKHRHFFRGTGPPSSQLSSFVTYQLVEEQDPCLPLGIMSRKYIKQIRFHERAPRLHNERHA